MRVWVLTIIPMAAAWPAMAGDLRPTTDFSDAATVLPADRGKPMIFVPPPVRPDPQRADPQQCLSPLPCGARIVGAIEKNGAIELRVPAWRW